MTDRKVFADSVTPLPDQPGLTPHGLMIHAEKPTDRNEKMTLLFSVGISASAQADLEARVAKGEIVPPEELRESYRSDQDDLNALVSWLKKQGYKIVQVTSDGTGVYAEGTIDTIEKSLAVNMVRVTKDGLTFTAAQNAPSLPSDVGNNVSAIIGLQPFRRAHKHSRTCVPKNGNAPALEGLLADHCAPVAFHRGVVCRRVIDAHDGHMQVPQRPGLGIDVDEAVIERYRVV